MPFPPRVGLPTDSKQLGHHRFGVVGEKYVRAVVDAADAVPWVVPLDARGVAPEAWLEPLDGLLLTGATSNVEPHRYGGGDSWEGNPHDRGRDTAVLEHLLPAALARSMPVLAICRGFQELNVFCGGSLHGRVHTVAGMMDHREDPDATVEVQYGPAHPVALTPGGLLAGIAGCLQIAVNSVHRQGVDRLGQGLIVEAVAEDGLVEAVRGAGNGFVLGVQWHPEWRVLENPFYRGIFQAFGDACRAYQVDKGKSRV